jgi:hypothetical protein
MLHVFMGLMRCLLNQLVIESKHDDKFMKALQQAFTNMDIKLPEKSSKDPSKKFTFEEQIKKARFQRTDFMNILEQRHTLLKALKECKRSEQDQEEVCINSLAHNYNRLNKYGKSLPNYTYCLYLYQRRSE